MTWQDLIRTRMEALSLTQQALAGALGITQGAVSKWLRGDSAPEEERHAALVRVLQITEPEYREIVGYNRLSFAAPPSPAGEVV